ncbi:hypothetical protein O4O00_23145 [Citrobacter sedlakii]|nr:hypothetical protein [Citrobacter sedlakii]MCZ4677236.1 hypothetical protein [Citrobacter sedlakii]MDR5007293.1 hypothetical protein [Citrobacter sedlakii]
MSFFYGVVMGGLFYLNCRAEALSMKTVVFIITMVISFIFGGFAGRGIA